MFRNTKDIIKKYTDKHSVPNIYHICYPKVRSYTWELSAEAGDKRWKQNTFSEQKRALVSWLVQILQLHGGHAISWKFLSKGIGQLVLQTQAKGQLMCVWIHLYRKSQFLDINFIHKLLGTKVQSHVFTSSCFLICTLDWQFRQILAAIW